MVQLASPTEPLSREFRFCSDEVFPPCLREPPPPSLDLFDLDMGLRLEFSGIHILISRAFSMDLPVNNHATGSLASLRIRCRDSGSHGPDSGCRGCQKASMTCFGGRAVRLGAGALSAAHQQVASSDWLPRFSRAATKAKRFLFGRGRRHFSLCADPPQHQLGSLRCTDDDLDFYIRQAGWWVPPDVQSVSSIVKSWRLPKTPRHILPEQKKAELRTRDIPRHEREAVSFRKPSTAPRRRGRSSASRRSWATSARPKIRPRRSSSQQPSFGAWGSTALISQVDLSCFKQYST